MKVARPLFLSLAASTLHPVVAVHQLRTGDDPLQAMDVDNDPEYSHWAVTGNDDTECDHSNPRAAEECKQAKEHNNAACTPMTHNAFAAHRECKYTNSEKCNIANMDDDRSTLVYPGNETECLLGIPYKFQVIKRDLDKLLITFQGGGSCASQKSIAMGMCCEKAVPHAPMGIHGGSYNFNGKEYNPFARHTVVHILYCSGDSHLANKTRQWSWKKTHVRQRGLLNAYSAIEWALRNMNKDLSSLVIHGSSAGSFATQAWANTLLSNDYFGSKNAYVILDCGIGVFDDDMVAKSLATASSECKQNLFSYDIYKKCVLKTLTFKDMLTDTIERYPKVPFLIIDSKRDPVLTRYYNLYQTMGGSDTLLEVGEYYKKIQTSMEKFAKYKNVGSFLLDKPQHTFLTDSATWRATASMMPSSPALMTWMRGILDGICHDGSWTCAGPKVKVADAPKSIEWCDIDTTGKQITSCNLPGMPPPMG